MTRYLLITTLLAWSQIPAMAASGGKDLDQKPDPGGVFAAREVFGRGERGDIGRRRP